MATPLLSASNTMRRSKASVSQVPSLRPELEFEVIKSILLRERYLQRLKALIEGSKTVDIGTIGLIDTLRDASLTLVETIRMWEVSQVDYPIVKPFMWNGKNYLEKMVSDTADLSTYSLIESWLGFSCESNPFFVPPEILDPILGVSDDAYIVFGEKPAAMSEKPKDTSVSAPRKKPAKSPYTTPIVNDPAIIPSLSIEAKMKKLLKRSKKEAEDRIVEKGKPTEFGEASIYETFLEAKVLKRIRKCWDILRSATPHVSAYMTLRMTESSQTALSSELGATAAAEDEIFYYPPELATSDRPKFAAAPKTAPPTSSASLTTGSDVNDAHPPPLTAPSGYRPSSSMSPEQFRSSLRSTHTAGTIKDPLQRQIGNEAMRLTTLPSSRDVTVTGGRGRSTTGISMGKSRVWTPHEINMQRVIQRSGGELHVLTAAGTKGRMKAPWRRNRFQRLETDFEYVRQQEEALSMAIEELELKRKARQQETALLAAMATTVGVDGDAGDTATRGANLLRPSDLLLTATEALLIREESQETLTGKDHRQNDDYDDDGDDDVAVTSANEDEVTEGASASVSAEAPIADHPFSLDEEDTKIGDDVVKESIIVPDFPAIVPEVQESFTASGVHHQFTDTGTDTRTRSTSATVTRAGDDEEEDEEEEEEVVDMPDLDTIAASIPYLKFIPNALRAAAEQWGSGEEKSGTMNRPGGTDDHGEREDGSTAATAAPLAKTKISLKAALAALKDLRKDVAFRRGLMKYQLDYLNMVSAEGDVTTTEKRKKMRTLTEGQTLEEDEKLAISLEDRMALRIQAGTRIRFGKVMRRALKLLMIKSATKIQQFWRRMWTIMQATRRVQALRLATLLQRLYRGKCSSNDAWSMRMQGVREAAVKRIQSVYRGHLGRLRSKMKKEFYDQINTADKCIGISGLYPSDIEELARAIDRHINSKHGSDFIPIQLLTVIRGLLFTLNGDSSEDVSAFKFGYYSTVHLTAATLTWQGAMVLIRRKARLLRRLRSLVRFVKKPNPHPLKFSQSCLESLDAIFKNITENDFAGMTVGKKAAMMFFSYCRALKRIHDLQYVFPDYFDHANPDWFRQLMKLKRDSMAADVESRLFDFAQMRIEELRQEFQRMGKRWGAVARARESVVKKLRHAESVREAAFKTFHKFVKKIETSNARKLKSLDDLFRSCQLGVQIARGDLQDYLNSVVEAPETKKLLLFRGKVEEKQLALVETSSAVVIARETIARDAHAMDFDKVIDYSLILESSELLGRITGQLMAQNEIWRDFLVSIGGSQFLHDLVGEQHEYHMRMKSEVVHFMAERRRLTELVYDAVDSELRKAKDIAEAARMAVIKTEWDLPSTIDELAELAEDRKSAIYEGDKDRLNKEKLEEMKIAEGPKPGIVLIVDIRVAKKLRREIITHFAKFRFVVCKTQQTEGLKLQDEIQKYFKEGKHAILFADRGCDMVSRAAFSGMINGIAFGLKPNPHIVVLDCTAGVRFENWFADHVPPHEALNLPVYDRADAARDDAASTHSHTNSDNKGDNDNITLGRMRTTALLLKHCITSSPGSLSSSSSSPAEVKAAPGGAVSVSVSDQSPSPSFDVTVPHWMRTIFLEDFTSFREAITASCSSNNSSSSSNNNSSNNSSSSFSGKPQLAKNVDAVLAATIAAVLGLWDPPPISWTDRNIQTGCKALLSYATNLADLFDLLAMRKAPVSSMLQNRKLNMARKLLEHLCYECKDFYAQPARLSLMSWCREALPYINKMAMQGGLAVDLSRKHAPDFVRSIQLNEDARDLDTEKLFGVLLHECFKSYFIHENDAADVAIYYDDAHPEDQSRPIKELTHENRLVKIYYAGDVAYVAVTVPGLRSDDPQRQLFVCVNMPTMVSMLQATGAETYSEEEDSPFLSDEASILFTQKWFNYITSWVAVDTLDGTRQARLQRVRYLILSKIGNVSGYKIRLELYEEANAEFLLFVYGLLPDNAPLTLDVTPQRLNRIASVCDKYEERAKYENTDSMAISKFFCDRLSIRPSKPFQDVLCFGEFPIQERFAKQTIKIRRRFGPGRRVGSKIVQFGGMILVISLYEILDDSETNGLRICLYDPSKAQAAEYRLSPMERLMLFTRKQSLFPQIIARLRLAYCNRTDKTRVMLRCNDGFVPASPTTMTSPATFKGGLLGNSNIDFDVVSLAEKVGPILPHGSQSLVFQSSTMSAFLFGNMSSVSMEADWGFAVYFNRSICEDTIGNLAVSVGLSIPNRGFYVIAHDRARLREGYRFLNYDEASRAFPEKTMDQLKMEILNLDEESLVDILDQIMRGIDVQDSGYYDVLTLVSQKQGIDSVNIALIQEKNKDRSFTIEIAILSASELSALHIDDARNAYCIVSLDGREIGRTNVEDETLFPEWKDCKFTAANDHKVDLTTRELLVEVYDQKPNNTQQQLGDDDFLGCVSLTGTDLVNLLSVEQPVTLNLQQSPQKTDEENEFVEGTLTLAGRMVSANAQASGGSPGKGGGGSGAAAAAAATRRFKLKKTRTVWASKLDEEGTSSADKLGRLGKNAGAAVASAAASLFAGAGAAFGFKKKPLAADSQDSDSSPSKNDDHDTHDSKDSVGKPLLSSGFGGMFNRSKTPARTPAGELREEEEEQEESQGGPEEKGKEEAKPASSPSSPQRKLFPIASVDPTPARSRRNSVRDEKGERGRERGREGKAKEAEGVSVATEGRRVNDDGSKEGGGGGMAAVDVVGLNVDMAPSAIKSIENKEVEHDASSSAQPKVESAAGENGPVDNKTAKQQHQQQKQSPKYSPKISPKGSYAGSPKQQSPLQSPKLRSPKQSSFLSPFTSRAASPQLISPGDSPSPVESQRFSTLSQGSRARIIAKSRSIKRGRSPNSKALRNNHESSAHGGGGGGSSGGSTVSAGGARSVASSGFSMLKTLATKIPGVGKGNETVEGDPNDLFFDFDDNSIVSSSEEDNYGNDSDGGRRGNYKNNQETSARAAISTSEQLPLLPGTLQLHLVAAERLIITGRVVFAIRLNGDEVARSFGYDIHHSFKAFDSSAIFDIEVPPGVLLAECSLEVEMMMIESESPSQSKGEEADTLSLGVVELRGSQLHALAFSGVPKAKRPLLELKDATRSRIISSSSPTTQLKHRSPFFGGCIRLYAEFRRPEVVAVAVEAASRATGVELASTTPTSEGIAAAAGDGMTDQDLFQITGESAPPTIFAKGDDVQPTTLSTDIIPAAFTELSTSTPPSKEEQRAESSTQRPPTIIPPFNPCRGIRHSASAHAQSLPPHCTYLLSVFAGRELRNSDQYASTVNPYVEVFFNGVLVGRSSSVTQSIDPVFPSTEIFHLLVPRGQPITGCSLDIELRNDATVITSGSGGSDSNDKKEDKRVKMEDESLGAVYLVGESLQTFLKSSERGASYLSLSPSIRYVNGDDQLSYGSVLTRCICNDHTVASRLAALATAPSLSKSSRSSKEVNVLFEVPRVEGIDAADGAGDVQLVLRWNGQEVRRCDVRGQPPAVQLINNIGILVTVPIGYHIRDCWLEIVLVRAGKRLAYNSLKGKDLLKFLKSREYEKSKESGWMVLNKTTSASPDNGAVAHNYRVQITSSIQRRSSSTDAHKMADSASTASGAAARPMKSVLTAGGGGESLRGRKRISCVPGGFAIAELTDVYGAISTKVEARELGWRHGFDGWEDLIRADPIPDELVHRFSLMGSGSQILAFDVANIPPSMTDGLGTPLSRSSFDSLGSAPIFMGIGEAPMRSEASLVSRVSLGSSADIDSQSRVAFKIADDNRSGRNSSVIVPGQSKEKTSGAAVGDDGNKGPLPDDDMSMATSVVDFDENDDGEFSMKSLMTALESKKSQSVNRPPHVLVELPGVIKKFFANQSSTDEWRVIWRGQYRSPGSQGVKLAGNVAQVVARQIRKQRWKMEKADSKLIITQDVKEISAFSNTRQISRRRLDIGDGGNETPVEPAEEEDREQESGEQKKKLEKKSQKKGEKAEEKEHGKKEASMGGHGPSRSSSPSSPARKTMASMFTSMGVAVGAAATGTGKRGAAATAHQESAGEEKGGNAAEAGKDEKEGHSRASSPSPARMAMSSMLANINTGIRGAAAAVTTGTGGGDALASHKEDREEVLPVGDNHHPGNGNEEQNKEHKRNEDDNNKNESRSSSPSPARMAMSSMLTNIRSAAAGTNNRGGGEVVAHKKDEDGGRGGEVPEDGRDKNARASSSSPTRMLGMSSMMASIGVGSKAVHQEVEGKTEASKGSQVPSRSSSPSSPARKTMASMFTSMGAAAVSAAAGAGGRSEEVINHTREAMKGKAIIVVKELLPDGPGLVTASYRVEVLAAGGKKLGYTEIESEDDLRSVVGLAKADELMPRDRSQWSIKAIFFHIVQERVVLKMPNDGGEIDSGGSSSGKSIGNVISLIRDKIPKPPAPSAKVRSSKMPPPLGPGEVRPEQIIVLQKTQQLVGMTFHSVLLLRARIRGFRSNPDRFFQSNPDQHWCLRQIEVIISCRCIRTGYTSKLVLPGTEMDEWLPEIFPLDLSKKFRRSKFATFVLLHLSVNYKPDDCAAFSVGLRRSRPPEKAPEPVALLPSTKQASTGAAVKTRRYSTRPQPTTGRPRSALFIPQQQQQED